MNNLGKYKVIKRIGSGSFGIVYKVEFDERFFAAKVPNSSEKFNNEIQIMHNLDHSNIAKVLDFDLNNTPPFYVMDYVEETLENYVKKTLDWNFSVNIVMDILDGLQYAHSKNVIHGDLKPSNILFSEEVMISDFGLAKIVQEENQKLKNSLATRESLGGTYIYASEEQFDGMIDKRNDLYSVGVMLYQLLTKSFPRGLILPSEINPDVPKDLDNIAKKALKQIDLRYQSASEFKEDLEKLFPKEPVKEKVVLHKEDLKPKPHIDTISIKPERRFLQMKYVEASYLSFASQYLSDIIKKTEQNLRNFLSTMGRAEVNIPLVENIDWKTNVVYRPVKMGFIEDGKEDFVKDLYTGEILSLDLRRGKKIHKTVRKARQKGSWDKIPVKDSVVLDSKEDETIWYYPFISHNIESKLDIDAKLIQSSNVNLIQTPRVDAKIYRFWKNHVKNDFSASFEFFDNGEFYDKKFVSNEFLEIIFENSEVDYEGVFNPNVSETKFRYATFSNIILGLLDFFTDINEDNKDLGFGCAMGSVLGGALGYLLGTNFFEETKSHIISTATGAFTGTVTIPLILSSLAWTVANSYSTLEYGIKKAYKGLKVHRLKKKFDKAVDNEVKILKQNKELEKKLKDPSGCFLDENIRKFIYGDASYKIPVPLDYGC